LNELVRRIEAEAVAEGGARVVRIRVRLGALSYFTARHLEEQFEAVSRGTLAEGAAIESELGTDPTELAVKGVLLESIELEC
jgi:Zn finger protein HypA/HybF involved in hydrogenase expression